MCEIINVRGRKIGSGRPKICVPLIAAELSELEAKIKQFDENTFDLLEWRADFFKALDSEEAMLEAGAKLRSRFPKLPLIFTIRTAEEGGEADICKEDYIRINHAAAASGLFDFVDVEWARGKECFDAIRVDKDCLNSIRSDKEACEPTRYILSNHDFKETPPASELIRRCISMDTYGGDILKIAMMPNSFEDVTALLSATAALKNGRVHKPLITISMGQMGVISRIAGEYFGSAITFGTNGEASAPGQIPAMELKRLLEQLSKYCGAIGKE